MQAIYWSHLTLNGIAARKWISLKARITCAHWLMIMNSAPCIETTWASARVTTLVTDTCKMCGTVLVNKTLWPTIRWCTQHPSETWADGSPVHNSAVRIGSTGWWYTWVCWWSRPGCYEKTQSQIKDVDSTCLMDDRRKIGRLVETLHLYCYLPTYSLSNAITCDSLQWIGWNENVIGNTGYAVSSM
jgi:hypothetical protein